MKQKKNIVFSIGHLYLHFYFHLIPFHSARFYNRIYTWCVFLHYHLYMLYSRLYSTFLCSSLKMISAHFCGAITFNSHILLIHSHCMHVNNDINAKKMCEIFFPFCFTSLSSSSGSKRMSMHCITKYIAK